MKAALLLAALLSATPSTASWAGTGVGGEIQSAQQNLDTIRHEISTKEKTVRAQTRVERNELDTLKRLNRELDVARRDTLTHKHNLGLVLERLTLLNAEAERLGGEEAGDRAFLESDLVALYKAHLGQQPLLLVSARSPFELQARAHYLAALASATSLRMGALSGDLNQLDSYKREFDSRYAELQARMREVENDSAKVERERRGKEAQLRAVRLRKARAVAAVRELKASADRLQGMLDGLLTEALRRDAERKRALALEQRNRQSQNESLGQNKTQFHFNEVAPGPFDGSGLGRGLPWPVEGEVLSHFGKHLHPVFHIPVFNRGIEISAGYGSPVRVVAPGLVDFAGEMEGFGHLVVVDHGEGMLSVYGYGSRLRVRKGQEVRQGEVLEDVGEAAGSRQPSLYFEIRRGVKAQDPLRYLARR
ncbi:MAG TPA: peptidoglycan DD-metalloendopeptidase family protein [bacterium]|nr:peptidoglycan DD-metalloendopeptidase family protein [bacterium]